MLVQFFLFNKKEKKDTDKVPENLANFESFLNHQKMNSRIKDLMSFVTILWRCRFRKDTGVY